MKFGRKRKEHGVTTRVQERTSNAFLLVEFSLRARGKGLFSMKRGCFFFVLFVWVGVGCSEDTKDVPPPVFEGISIMGIRENREESVVQLDLTILDKRGNAEVDLTRTRFRVYETPVGGERFLVYNYSGEGEAFAVPPEPPIEFEFPRVRPPRREPAVPVVLGMVLDRSGSMNENEEAMMQDGALNLLGRLRAGDQVEVINFSEEIYVDASFRDYNAPKVAQAIISPTTRRGWTRLFDAVIQGSEDISRHATPLSRRALLIVSDGEDNRSVNTVDRSIEVARASEASLFIVGLADESDPSDLHPDILDRMARETGGRFFLTFSAGFFDAILSAIGRSLTTSYRLEYTSPFPETERTIAVEVDLEGETLTYERRYIPPSAP